MKKNKIRAFDLIYTDPLYNTKKTQKRHQIASSYQYNHSYQDSMNKQEYQEYLLDLLKLGEYAHNLVIHINGLALIELFTVYNIYKTSLKVEFRQIIVWKYSKPGNTRAFKLNEVCQLLAWFYNPSRERIFNYLKKIVSNFKYSQKSIERSDNLTKVVKLQKMYLKFQ